MELRVYDPYYNAVEGIDVQQLTWPQRLDEADFIVFSAPLNAATHHMLNSSVLPGLKDGVRIVNVGRGPVIEEQALIDDAGRQFDRIRCTDGTEFWFDITTPYQRLSQRLNES